MLPAGHKHQMGTDVSRGATAMGLHASARTCCLQGRSHGVPVDQADFGSSKIPVLTPNSQTSRGLLSAPGAFSSSRLAPLRFRVSSHGAGLMGSSPCQARRLSRCLSFRLGALQFQLLDYFACQGANRAHRHCNVLSRMPSTDGQRTIGKELTHGTKSLPPDGKAYD